jgi:di/tripeptidase
VVDAGGADVMSTLLRLKKEVEETKGFVIKMVFVGGEEAHLIADEIGVCFPSRIFYLTT